MARTGRPKANKPFDHKVTVKFKEEEYQIMVEYAPPHSLRKKTVFQSPTPSNARTAITRWLIRKTANTLLSTNA